MPTKTPITTVDDLVGEVLPAGAPPAPRQTPDPQLLAKVCEDGNQLADKLGFPNLATDDYRRVTLLGGRTSAEAIAKHEEYLRDNPVLQQHTLSADVFGTLGTLRNAAVAVKSAARPVARLCLQSCHDSGNAIAQMVAVAQRALESGADLSPEIPYVMVASVLGELKEELARQEAQALRAQKKGKKLKGQQQAEVSAARERLTQAESVQRFKDAVQQGGKEQ